MHIVNQKRCINKTLQEAHNWVRSACFLMFGDYKVGSNIRRNHAITLSKYAKKTVGQLYNLYCQQALRSQLCASPLAPPFWLSLLHRFAPVSSSWLMFSKCCARVVKLVKMFQHLHVFCHICVFILASLLKLQCVSPNGRVLACCSMFAPVGHRTIVLQSQNIRQKGWKRPTVWKPFRWH